MKKVSNILIALCLIVAVSLPAQKARTFVCSVFATNVAFKEIPSGYIPASTSTEANFNIPSEEVITMIIITDSVDLSLDPRLRNKTWKIFGGYTYEDPQKKGDTRVCIQPDEFYQGEFDLEEFVDTLSGSVGCSFMMPIRGGGSIKSTYLPSKNVWVTSNYKLHPSGIAVPVDFVYFEKIEYNLCQRFGGDGEKALDKNGNPEFFLGKIVMETGTGRPIVIPASYMDFLSLPFNQKEGWIWDEKNEIVLTTNVDEVKKNNDKRKKPKD